MDLVNQNTVTFNQALQHQQSYTQFWQYLIEQAREKIKHSDWDGACIAYKEAFAITEKLLCNQCNQNCSEPCDISRYLNTAEEFAFAMRKNNFDCALEVFISQIKEKIADKESKLAITDLTRRLMALASSPKQELDQLYRQCLA